MTATLPERLATVELETSPEMAQAYAELTSDFNPVHTDPGFAAGTPFGRPITHGTMALNLVLLAAERTFGDALPPVDLAVRFVKPVPVGTTVRATGALADPALGIYNVHVDTEDGARAIEGTLIVGRP
jgi:3-hydroxybutyryl-CoA dehydratase